MPLYIAASGVLISTREKVRIRSLHLGNHFTCHDDISCVVKDPLSMRFAYNGPGEEDICMCARAAAYPF